MLFSSLSGHITSLFNIKRDLNPGYAVAAYFGPRICQHFPVLHKLNCTSTQTSNLEVNCTADIVPQENRNYPESDNARENCDKQDSELFRTARK